MSDKKNIICLKSCTGSFAPVFVCTTGDEQFQPNRTSVIQYDSQQNTNIKLDVPINNIIKK
ncbi:MAG: hypothetical protein VB017_05950 [Endomicrobiaceae bacterium]|nr:hypothetical protein [Endomicrobiaceae bacterium]